MQMTIPLAQLFAALGNEQRLKIVELLQSGEKCLCQITPRFQLDPSVVSRHLAILERAGLIVGRRDGRWIHYRLAHERLPRLLQLARSLSADSPHRIRMRRVC